jgi:hypothetical protein
MKALVTIAAACLATGASAQVSVTLAVVLDSGPFVGNGQAVRGTLRLTWTDPEGIGYSGGAFRLRFSDTGGNFGAADITLPNEVNVERIGIHGASTIWSSGRRPRTFDGETGNADGSFRFPAQGTGATNIGYRAEAQNGMIFLTGRNGAGVENQIEHAQLPPAVPPPPDPPLFVTDTSFDLFKFTVRAPLTGSGTVTITPEMIWAAVFISESGMAHHTTAEQRTMVPASFFYTIPAPGVGWFVVAVGMAARRRR